MDWLSFLRAHRIEFVESGPNVARGNVNIRCPMCGSGDPSHHLGISLQGKGWGCFRSSAHRGKSPARLIQALLNVSYPEALRLSGVRAVTATASNPVSRVIRNLGLEANPSLAQPGPGSPGSYPLAAHSHPPAPVGPPLSARLSRRGAVPYPPATLGPPGLPATASEALTGSPGLAFPAAMKPLRVTPATRLFTGYLESRGYPEAALPALTADYGLRYARIGSFANRIIFPISLDGRLVTWTGRTLGKAKVRYKTLSTDPEKAKADDVPVALLPITYCLWNFDSLAKSKAELLVICEGPFDALRVDFYGRTAGIRGTCIFTKDVSDAQINLLSALALRYQRRILILDEDAELDILRIQRKLAWLDIEPYYLRIAKDPALLTPMQIRGLRKLR